MNLNKILRITAVVLMLSLSACTVTPKANLPTDEEIHTALIDKLNVDGTTTILSAFEVISHAPEGIHDDVVTTFTLKTEDGVFDLRANLRYLKVESDFRLYNVDYETLSAQVDVAVDLEEPMRILETDIDLVNDHDFIISETQMYGNDWTTGCVLVNPDTKDGTAVIDCVESRELLDIKGIGTSRFKATYDFVKGWVYTYDTWSYVETIEFNKPLKFKFPSAMVYNGSTIFTENEPVILDLDGTLVINYPGSMTRSVDSTMSGTMNHNGKLTPVTVEITDGDHGHLIGISFGSRPEEFLLLEVQSGGLTDTSYIPPSYWLRDTNGNTAKWITD